MQWEEYVQHVLKKEKQLDGISVEIDEENIDIPQIIKASIYLLEKMIKKQGRYNLFVFPDGKYTPFVFMLSKLIYNICIGKIESNYDVSKFKEGQKLKFGNCIAEFIKIDYEPAFNADAIYIKFSDCTYICDIAFAPYFQTVDTKRPISGLTKFNQEKKKIKAEMEGHSDTLKSLAEMKTHMSESMIFISSLSKSTDLMKKIKLDGKDISDFFFVSQTDYTGKIETVKGKYSGTPALILSSNLAYANEAVRSGAVVQSVIINLNDNDIDSQLSELDEMIQLKVPIVCVADTVHSFELDELKRRGFNIWRWDENSITSDMCQTEDRLSVKNSTCRRQEVTYHEIKGPLISDSFQILYGYRKKMEDESSTVNGIYNVLFDICCSFLRRVYMLSDVDKVYYESKMSDCRKLIEKEKDFITEKMYLDFTAVIDHLTKVISDDAPFSKIEKIEDTIFGATESKICMVCANNDNTDDVKKEWEKIFYSHGYTPTFKVLTVREFLKNPVSNDYSIYLCGWFGAKTVRQILYGYDALNIHVFLYECESRWKKAHSKSWKKRLDDSNNKEIAQKSFSRKNREIELDISYDIETEKSSKDSPIILEQDDTELIIQENKYRQYISKGAVHGGIDVEACPIGFIGGEFALFTKGHKSLVVTKIVHQITNKIEEKETETLRVGDFVVIREASKDIIRDVADKILEASGKADIRKRVELWKEALRIESTFSSLDEIYVKLKEEGCTRNLMTVKNWINSDAIIIPQSKDDLKAIAKATGDEVLLEKLDTIFEEGSFIKRAHIKAGNVLSERLTTSIAQKLMEDRSFDPYNIWDPIELNLEDVGTVRIYKIIDISPNWMIVNSFDTNRLMSEEKEI